jgi:hypothetical protein
VQLELSPHAIPNFLTAESPQGLRRAMLRNNARLGGFVNYFGLGQITLRGRLVFVAWFYDRVESDADLAQMMTDDVTGVKR